MTQVDVFQSELNPFNPAIRDDPYPVYRALRERAPIIEGAPGVWLLTRYNDCLSMLHDSRFGHLEPGEEPANPMFGRLGDGIEPMCEPDGTPVISFIATNPPGHTRVRRQLTQSFTVRSVTRWAPRIGAIVDGILDRALAAPEFDLLAEVAYPLSVTVIGEVLGVPPGDYAQFSEWTEQICGGLDPALMQEVGAHERMRTARQEFADYFLALAVDRRARPRADVLSEMVGAASADDRLSDVEFVVTCTLLLIAGYETTANFLANSVVSLLHHPHQLAYLRGQAEVPVGAAEELLRFEAPGQLASRVARVDTEVAGIVIPKGHSVLALLGAANRDPDRFADPNRLDLRRPDVKHLSFGQGIHLCLGAQLARLEVCIALGRLLERAPQLEVAGPLVWKPHAALRGLQQLVVRHS
jgi:cytochrome P450